MKVDRRTLEADIRSAEFKLEALRARLLKLEKEEAQTQDEEKSDEPQS